MQYLCLGYLDEAAFDRIPDAEKTAILEHCYAECIPFRATGKVVEERGLESSHAAKSLRYRKGKTMVTDGPFTETKEQLGSFFIVEAESMEEAVRVAALHPAAKMGEEYGFGIEIRPIQ